MHEMEVYGEEVSDHTPSEPATIDPNDPENLAFGKTTTANMNKKTSQLAVDGITEYGWDAKIYPANVEVNLGQAYDLSDVQLFFLRMELRSINIHCMAALTEKIIQGCTRSAMMPQHL